MLNWLLPEAWTLDHACPEGAQQQRLMSRLSCLGALSQHTALASWACSAPFYGACSVQMLSMRMGYGEPP